MKKETPLCCVDTDIQLTSAYSLVFLHVGVLNVLHERSWFQLANEPAKKSKSPAYYLTPLLPGNSNIGHLKDMAQEIIAASAGLAGKVATKTAIVLGDQLRLINSYYSNLIEGHKTTIPEISMALQKKFSQDPEKNTRRNCVPPDWCSSLLLS